MSDNPCKLKTQAICEFVNKERSKLKLSPIENQAISTRCSLRFNINSASQVDFSQEFVTIDHDELADLENLLNDQFALFLDGSSLKKLCGASAASEKNATAAPKASSADNDDGKAKTEVEEPAPPADEESVDAPAPSGISGWVKRLFG